MSPLTFNTWLELGLKGAVVLLTAAVACGVLRRASAASRHLIWTAAVVAVLALPALSAVVPDLPLPLASARLESALPQVSVPLARRPTESPVRHAGVQTTASARPARPAATADPARPTVEPIVVPTTSILLGLWALGAAVLLARLAAAMSGVRRLVKTAVPVDDEAWDTQLEAAGADLNVSSLPELRWSPALSVPMTCGIVRPTILLPVSARHWEPSRVRVVLLHELAHVRRRDCLVHCVTQAALALHWFNPLMWLAQARLRAERERACDDLVLVAGTHGPDYAEHLLDIARQFRRQAVGLAAVAMARPSELEGRLLAILDPLRSRRPADPVRLLWAVASAALFVLPVAGIRLQADALVLDEPEVQAPTPTPAPTPAPAPTPTPAPAPAPPAPQGGVKGGVRGGVAGGVRTEARPDAEKEKGAISDATREQVAKALANALKDDNPAVRQEAMQALAQMRSPLAFEPMLAALKDTDPELRQQAAFSLGELDDPRAVGPLTAALKDSVADVRQQAAFALGQLHAKDAVPALAGALKDEGADVREQAAFALGQIGDASAVQPLVAALKDADEDVREQAAFALGQIGDPSALPGLIQALSSDQKADVREQAAFALSQLGDARAVDALTTAMQKDADPEVRQQAAFALGQVFGREGHTRDRQRDQNDERDQNEEKE
jgi:HEAT repeat protein/beta-lactamase regulating signal transducer with metallopeptidase domain